MKNCIFFLLAFACLIGDELSWQNAGAYAQLSSVANQVPTPGIGSLLTFDTVNLIKNFEITPKRDGIVCRIPGKYLVYSSIQPAAFCRGISGYVDSWFVVNGIPLKGSNARQYIDENSHVAQLMLITMLELVENDVLSSAFSASDPNIGIIFIQSALSSEPSVTSFLLTAYKIQ